MKSISIIKAAKTQYGTRHVMTFLRHTLTFTVVSGEILDKLVRNTINIMFPGAGDPISEANEQAPRSIFTA
jgi:hypothetical protein